MRNHFSEFHRYEQLSLDRMGIYGCGNAKAYFRFHGGIGDGNGSVAFRNIEENNAARPLQLFDDLSPLDLMGGFVKNSVIGPTLPSIEAIGGTGVFLPVYAKKIRSTKGKRVYDGFGGPMTQEDVCAKPSVVDETVKAEGGERKGINQLHPELLLPAEWPYEVYMA